MMAPKTKTIPYEMWREEVERIFKERRPTMKFRQCFTVDEIRKGIDLVLRPLYNEEIIPVSVVLWLLDNRYQYDESDL